MLINRFRINRLALSEPEIFVGRGKNSQKKKVYPFFKPAPPLALLKPVIPHYL
jgi:hypothetical protein